MPGTLSTTLAATGFAAVTAAGFAGRAESAWRAVSPQPTTIAANSVAAAHLVCWFMENRSCNRKS
jgi:hypothetical protein